MNKYKITIVGSGNAGCAHAAMFSLMGHQVTLFKSSAAGNCDNFEYLKRSKRIGVEDFNGNESCVPLHNVTTDPKEAFEDCELCMIMVQTLYHRELAVKLAKFVKHLKLLFVVPGYMGSLYFHNALGDRVDNIAEGESTAYDARIIKPGKVKILFKNVRNAIGVLKGDKDYVVSVMSDLVETYRFARRNIIDSALHNPNLIVHTIGAVMSAARIEYSRGEFWMYKEAFTPSVWNLISALDDEKMNILERFGCERISYLEACRFRNCKDLSIDPMKVFQSYAKSGGPKGPLNVKSRYILEDIPMGLGLMNCLGKKCGCETRICDSLITLGGALVKRDFLQEARNFSDEALRLVV